MSGQTTTRAQPLNSPAQGIWRRFLLLVPLVLALAIGSFLHIRSKTGSLWVTWVKPDSVSSVPMESVTLSEDGVVSMTSYDEGDPFVTATFEALSDGEVDVMADLPDRAEPCLLWHLRVRNGAVYEGINFAGWEILHVNVCILLGAVCLLFLSSLVRLWRARWYGYTMVACGGGLLYCLFQFALFLFLLLRRSFLCFDDLVYGITYMADYFVLLTLLPTSALALLVSISNISLIRHEGRRPANLLGIAISVVWGAANVFWLRGGSMLRSMNVPTRYARVAESLGAVAISFGVCLLLSTIVCAWLASWHRPSHHADYLVILGCGLRKDGTPCPLLAGRVDKAHAFDQRRIDAGEAPATYVPSGGQGPDEVMSEAQSMANYLVSKGVPAERIVLEDRSTTTRENMLYSREAIERHAKRDVSQVSVAFSTTNYHVFRGYVCAHRAGMAVEGMGSRTRAYFWPNAFLREFAGLIVVQWRSILQVYVLVSGIYALAEYLLTLAY